MKTRNSAAAKRSSIVLAWLVGLSLTLGLVTAVGPARALPDAGVEPLPTPRGSSIHATLYDNDSKALVPSGTTLYFVDFDQNSLLDPTAGIELPESRDIRGIALNAAETAAYVIASGSQATQFRTKLFKVNLDQQPPTLDTVWEDTAAREFEAGTLPGKMVVAPDESWVAYQKQQGATMIVVSATPTQGAPTLISQPSSGPLTGIVADATGTTLYGAQSDNGQEFYKFDLSDPANPTTQTYTLGTDKYFWRNSSAALSPDGSRLYAIYRSTPTPSSQSPDERHIIGVFDTSTGQELEAIGFDDPEVFDLWNAADEFGRAFVYDLIATDDALYVADTTPVGENGFFVGALIGYDLQAGRWIGVAQVSTSQGFTQRANLDVDANGNVLYALDGNPGVAGSPTNAAKIPTGALVPTLRPAWELVVSQSPAGSPIGGEREESGDRRDIAVAPAGDNMYVGQPRAVDVFPGFPDVRQRNYAGIGINPNFESSVKGELSALVGEGFNVWVKTQDGADGYLYSWAVTGAVSGAPGGWVEAKNVPANLFPGTETGANDLVKIGSTLYAIARDGVAVFDIASPELTYNKTIQVAQPLTGLVASSDGSKIYAAGPEGLAEIDVASEAVTEKDLTGSDLAPTGALTPSADGATLYAGTKDAAGMGQITEVDAATLEPGESRSDDRLASGFDPVAIDLGTDGSADTQVWVLGGAVEQVGVLYTASENLWSVNGVGSNTPNPGTCRAVVAYSDVDGYAACENGLYIVRGRGPSFPSGAQPTAPSDITNPVKPEAPAAPAVSPTPVPPVTAPSVPPAEPVKKTTKVKAKAKQKKSKLKVKVTEKPKLGPQNQWKFKVKKKKKGKFRNIKRNGKVKFWKTSGRKHTKLLNFPKGKYRAFVKPQIGYEGSKSKVVRLKR